MKSIKNIFVLLLVLIAISSCERLLNIDQEDIVEYEQNYQSQYDGRGSILGIYQGFQNLVEPIFLLGELRGDLVLSTDHADLPFKELNDCIYSNSNPYLDPAPFYKVINQANDVFVNLDKLQANDPTITDVIRERMEAELTYLKATCYLYLMRIFDRVVYLDTPIIEHDEEVIYSYMDKDILLDSLITQVDRYKHVTGIVSNEELAGGPLAWYRFRFTNYPPHQLLGELYLERGDYVNAEVSFRNIIDVAFTESPGRNWGLQDFAMEQWKEMFDNSYNYPQNYETLLLVPFSKKDNQTHHLQYWCSNDADGVYYLQPSGKCVSNFSNENDIHRGEGASYYGWGGEFVIYKHFISRELYDNDQCFIIWRAGDLWLDYAETLNHLGDPMNALSVLNTGSYNGETLRGGSGIRGRVGLLPKDLSDLELLTLQDTIDAVDEIILEERALETAFEGNRFFDLVRIAKYRDDSEFLAKRISEKYIDPERRELLYNRLLDENNWYIPVEDLEVESLK